MRVLLMWPTYQRCLVLATIALFVCGCGSKGLHEPVPRASGRIPVTAPWPNGARIPRRYTCDGGDATPSVQPSGAKTALVMTDPDAPGGGFVHWTRWGSVEGKNSFGKTGYSGPCPPRGDEPHHYVLTVYSLRRPLALRAGAPPEDVVAAIEKFAVASGSVTGLYGR
jgi:phosphatidylethanolamine-binding protein (PEBP) family uncharacterized protein